MTEINYCNQKSFQIKFTRAFFFVHIFFRYTTSRLKGKYGSFMIYLNFSVILSANGGLFELFVILYDLSQRIQRKAPLHHVHIATPSSMGTLH